MKTLLAILRLLPVILEAVRALESAIPLPGQGKKKLDLILQIIKSAYDASSTLAKDVSFEKLVAVIVPMIARIVDLHNALGLFEKPAQPSKA